MAGIIQTDGANNITGENIGDGIGKKHAAHVTCPPTIFKFEDAGSGVYYCGSAAPGSLTSEPVWRIEEITISGSDADILLAGTGASDQVWDDRAGLIYS